MIANDLATKNLSDLEIIARILQGEKAFFELLIRRHNPSLYRVGRSYGFGHPDIEDLLQDTHVAAYLNLKNFEGKSSYKTWLIKIMINKCLRTMEKASYKSGEHSGTPIDENAKPMYSPPEKFDTEKLVLNRELAHLLEKSIEQLPEDYRNVFVLREVEGMHVNETAEILDITDVNVKVRLNRAKAMLRKEIQKYYSSTSIYEFNLVYCDKIVNTVFERINSQI